MRTIQKMAMAVFIACAGICSTAEAAPMAVTSTVGDQPAVAETVRYDGGHRYRAYQGHLRRARANEGHRRRAYHGHLRRQDAHYRRKAAHYRRAYP